MTSLIYRVATGMWEISCDICGEKQEFLTENDADNWIDEHGEICKECNKGWKCVPDNELGGYKYTVRKN